MIRKIGLVCLLMCFATAAHAGARYPKSDLSGRWRFASKCFSGQFLDLTLARTSNGYTGTWGNGSDLEGVSGNVLITLRRGKSIVKMCNDKKGASSDMSACPKMEVVTDQHFVRQGANLLWYGAFSDLPVKLVRIAKHTPLTYDNRECGGKP